jgi:cysteinyl-tRNA synthetase
MRKGCRALRAWAGLGSDDGIAMTAGGRHWSAAITAVGLALGGALSPWPASAAKPDDVPTLERPAPEPKPAARPVRSAPVAPPAAVKPAPTAAPAPASVTKRAAAQADRLRRLLAVKSWGYQLADLTVEEAAKSPYDLLVIDANLGLASGKPVSRADVDRLKRKPDGSQRMVVAYLSVGEAEDYRADYFSPEYLSEDAPDWLLKENDKWRGNRLVRFCHEGWQRTILGDDDGRNLYNILEPSPLYRIVETGFDGVYLDRVDAYAELGQECPDGARKMVDFVVRIGAHARKRAPGFLMILQNAEELTRHKAMLDAIDGIAKEDLFYGADHSQSLNAPAMITGSLGHLKAVKASGRAVLVVDYVTAPETKADAKKRIEAEGFVPYIGPRDLGRLWLPGKDF